MNTPSPLVPQGSFLEQKNKSRARVRLAVFFVLSIHVIALMALLMQGCRKPAEPVAPPPETNPPVAPTFEQAPPPVMGTNVPETNVPAPPPVVQSVPPSTPVPPPSVAGQDYTVAKGDSFYSIAKKFGLTTKEVLAANPGVEPTRLQIGQKIHIPPPSAATAPSAASTPETGTGGEVYTVKSGDTLTRIAAHYHTTVKAIRAENNLTTDRIKVGQKLKIPTSAAVPAPPESAPTPMAPPATNSAQ